MYLVTKLMVTRSSAFAQVRKSALYGKAQSVPSASIASKIVVYERREKKTIACPKMSVRPRND